MSWCIVDGLYELQQRFEVFFKEVGEIRWRVIVNVSCVFSRLTFFKEFWWYFSNEFVSWGYYGAEMTYMLKILLELWLGPQHESAAIILIWRPLKSFSYWKLKIQSWIKNFKFQMFLRTTLDMTVLKVQLTPMRNSENHSTWRGSYRAWNVCHVFANIGQ